VEAQRPVLFECLCCGLTQIPPASYGTGVSDYYVDAEDTSYLENFPVKLRTFEKAYRKLTPFLPGGKLKFLDIGSYYGAFLQVLAAQGHTGCGLEPSKSAARYSQEVLGHQVANELFSEGRKFAGQEFDVVTSWDVIEHIEDPEKFLEEVGRVLGEGKLFAFSTIMIDSLLARVLKKRWHWILPMHLTYYKHHDLCDMLKRHNFELLGHCNHTHYASLGYAVQGASAHLPPLARSIGLALSRLLPKTLVLPFALGDVRMYVCRKLADRSSAALNSIGGAQ
jgi:SAM-dependent methyltransferase